MFMVPLPFVIALLAAIFAVYEALTRGLERRSGWFLAFLGLICAQQILVGLRFGYGVDSLRLVQALSATFLPPLAYLAFRRPALGPAQLVHLLPLLAGALALVCFIDALDPVLALTNLIYAVLLIRLGLGGSDALGWVETHRGRAVLTLLWLVAAVQMITFVADVVIAVDFVMTDGRNTLRILSWMTVLGLLAGLLGYTAVTWMAKRARATPESQAADNEATFRQLSALVDAEKLHLDPDINLNRIARRMMRPAREVSRAVNAVAGCNVSLYINRLRVRQACRLLEGSDMSVTQVIYAAGFDTKSNFNREFTRNTGQTPSAWRAARVGAVKG
ncbi:MAG: AraC family transcriptional regulator [Pseudomonadota bacterium]